MSPTIASPTVLRRLLGGAGLVLAAAWLRAYDLVGQSLWSDEDISLDRARLPLDVMLDTLPVEHGPLYFAFLRAWTRLAGESDLALRWPSLLAGVVAVPLVYVLARRLVGKRAAWPAALLTAVNPFLVSYGQEARMYTALLALAAGAYVAASRGFDRTPATSRPRIAAAPLRRALCCGVLLALAVGTHYYGALAVAALGAWAVLDLARLREPAQGRALQFWAIAFGAAFLAFLPLLPRALRVFEHPGWREPASLARAPWLLATAWSAQTAQTAGTAPTPLEVAATALILALVTLGLLALTRRRVWRPILLFAVPALLAAALLLRNPDYHPRYYFALLPAWLLLVAAGAAELGGWLTGRFGVEGRRGWRHRAADASGSITATGEPPSAIATDASRPTGEPRMSLATGATGAARSTGGPRPSFATGASRSTGSPAPTLATFATLAVGALLVLAAAPGLVRLHVDPAARKQDVRRLVQMVDATTQGRDSVLLLDGPSMGLAKRYLPVGSELKLENLQSETNRERMEQGEDAFFARLDELVERRPNVWLASDGEAERLADARLAAALYYAGGETVQDVSLARFYVSDPNGPRLWTPQAPRLEPTPSVPEWMADRQSDAALELMFPQDIGEVPKPVEAGELLPVVLGWRTGDLWSSRAPATRAHHISLRLTNEHGHIVLSDDRAPAAGLRPTNKWHAGETIIDLHALPIPEDLAPGRYEASAVLYDAASLVPFRTWPLGVAVVDPPRTAP